MSPQPPSGTRVRRAGEVAYTRDSRSGRRSAAASGDPPGPGAGRSTTILTVPESRDAHDNVARSACSFTTRARTRTESCECARRPFRHRPADDQPADRARDRGPAPVGPRGQPARHRPRRGLLRRHRLRHRGRLPPPLHAPQLPSGALAEDPARVDRFDGRRGFRRRLGRDPSPPSRLQRQARRSALAARVRPRTGRATPRLRARARRLVVQDRPDLGTSATPPTCSPTPTR